MLQNNAVKKLGSTNIDQNKNNNKAKVTFFGDYTSKEKNEESDPENIEENEIKFDFAEKLDEEKNLLEEALKEFEPEEQPKQLKKLAEKGVKY